MRLLLVLLILVAFTSIQSMAAVDVHDHSHPGSHARCCLGCHAGYLPAIQAFGDVQVAPPNGAEWWTAKDESPVKDRHLNSSDSSRAPPA